jgi:Trk K+ transport system NAD-binding subunit
VLVVLVYRDGRILMAQGGAVLEAGDRVLPLAEGDAYQAAREILTGRGTDGVE